MGYTHYGGCYTVIGDLILSCGGGGGDKKKRGIIFHPCLSQFTTLSMCTTHSCRNFYLRCSFASSISLFLKWSGYNSRNDFCYVTAVHYSLQPASFVVLGSM